MPHPHCTSPICQLEGQWSIVVKTNFNAEKAEVGKRADEYEALATICREWSGSKTSCKTSCWTAYNITYIRLGIGHNLRSAL